MVYKKTGGGGFILTFNPPPLFSYYDTYLYIWYVFGKALCSTSIICKNLVKKCAKKNCAKCTHYAVLKSPLPASEFKCAKILAKCSRKIEYVLIIFNAVSAKIFEISWCGFSILIRKYRRKRSKLSELFLKFGVDDPILNID